MVIKPLARRDMDLVEAKLAKLAKVDAKQTELAQKMEALHDANTPETVVKYERAIRDVLDAAEEANKLFTELKEMMRYTLRNCFGLTIAQMDVMSLEEQVAIFKSLAGK
ncbi:hypothetical protein [Candidatus Nitrososphaera sp. FF02]|uniref:hypothetical protein n=1 Tax=Candidatus Nitrososphaera sp. FF02 TaxID=3398226 RepID=UPI0039E90CEA